MLPALLFFAAEVGAQPNHFRLVCPGTQSGSIATTSVGHVTASNGKAADVNVTSSKPYFSEETARVEIDGDEGRVTQSSSNHWSALTNIVITNEEIRATVHLNWPFKTHMRIDRTTGELAIPLGDTVLHGICKLAPEDGKRAF